jgi:hypothetical protein
MDVYIYDFETKLYPQETIPGLIVYQVDLRLIEVLARRSGKKRLSST